MGVAQQLRELHARVGLAVTERRGFRPRPPAAAVRHDHQQPAAGVERPPDLAQHLAGMMRVLDRVDQQRPVERARGQRQLAIVDQRRGARLAARRPVDDALLRRHEGEGAHGLVAVGLEEGQRVAEPHDALPDQARPALAHVDADVAHDRGPERGRVEVPEIGDVGRHRRDDTPARARGGSTVRNRGCRPIPVDGVEAPFARSAESRKRAPGS